MEINADRRGPKDIRMLAAKKSAFMSLADSKVKLEQAQQSGVPAIVQLAQKRHDDNFEYLMDLHDNDTAQLQETAEYIRGRRSAGKEI